MTKTQIKGGGPALNSLEQVKLTRHSMVEGDVKKQRMDLALIVWAVS